MQKSVKVNKNVQEYIDMQKCRNVDMQKFGRNVEMQKYVRIFVCKFKCAKILRNIKMQKCRNIEIC